MAGERYPCPLRQFVTQCIPYGRPLNVRILIHPGGCVLKTSQQLIFAMCQCHAATPAPAPVKYRPHWARPSRRPHRCPYQAVWIPTRAMLTGSWIVRPRPPFQPAYNLPDMTEPAWMMPCALCRDAGMTEVLAINPYTLT